MFLGTSLKKASGANVFNLSSLSSTGLADRTSNYEEEGGITLADRFFSELEQIIKEIQDNPLKFHKISDQIRRANMGHFPYHLLFRCDGNNNIRVLILRHHNRNPELGLRRR
ncbi:MAG: type II toxin-antitoxin system RelE/ParE family toxin [Opitutales bacterium]|nr:type II toxin-antitoxin system RelE/ParE family toxin [Opitutales bacterium]